MRCAAGGSGEHGLRLRLGPGLGRGRGLELKKDSGAVQPCRVEPSIRAMGLVRGALLAALLAVLVLAQGAAAETEEACETLPSEIHIVKEEFDELGRLSRTCNGDIAVNKCEGACSSQVQPSVITPTGFLKECYCCRESFLRERVVSLTHCYDPDGARLTAEGRHSMEVKLREPADCRCAKCGDYSR